MRRVEANLCPRLLQLLSLPQSVSLELESMAEGGSRALDLIKDTAISYIVNLALDKLFSCLQSGVGSLLGDGDELGKIKSSLKTILSVIGSAEERPLKDQALIDWLEKLKDAAYDAEDVLDEYATEDLRRKVEAQNSDSVRDPDTNKVRKIASSLLNYPVVNRAKMTLKLKEIRERLESIEEERHKFQLSERVLNWEREFKEHRQTQSFLDESEVYGRDEDREKIVNLLLLPVVGHEDENVSVITIVGMGGLGKTTLAQLVFNDDRVQNHFELKMWVCVSDDFDITRLMKKIIDRAAGSNSNVSDLDELQRRVRKALIGRRFLLVLDDVWNEELEKWNKLRVLLMCGGRGSRIVVTTRSPMIASIMSRIKPHHLEGLSEKDCWKLFARRAFPDHRAKDHLNLVEIGIDIVGKCGGVPLAVITLGSLLSFKREESEWVFVRDSELWNLAAENVHGILPALRLSYYHLNPHLRQCFAFCAIFPKDYNMNKELLVQLWTASGCVPSRRGMELEDIGIEILNELLMRSLFQKVKEDGGGDYLKVKVHDLVHDLAQSVMGSDCCIIELGKSVNISKRVRHFSFHRINSPRTPPNFLYEAQSLRTLLMLQSDIVVPQDISIFKFLRVLELRCSRELPLLTSLGELIHLRYFGLTYASIETLPESISNLQNLRTWKLYSCFDLQELPKGTKNLINLRCLDIDSCDSLSHLPANIGNLSCLQKLPLFVVGDSASVCSGIEELQCLNLRGNLRIDHLERIAIPSNAQRANLIGKPKLDSLQLCWHIPNDDDDDDDNTLKIEVEEEVLKGLQPHENLKELEIISYGGIHFPSWMMGFLLPNIVKITLEDCRRCECLPPLGQLPSLKFLHIECMDCVENIGNEFYGNDLLEGFASLETLEIVDMSSLKVWSGLHGERVFPRLVKLKIVNCPMLTTIPCFPYLKRLQLRSTDPLLLGSVANCTSLSSFKMKDYNDLTSLPQGMLQSLASLKSLKIEECENLSSLHMRLQNTTSLEYMRLWSCGLLSFPDEEEIQGLSSLLELTIENCMEMISLSTGVQHLTALQTLSIKRCDKLVNFPDELQRLASLQILKISHCTDLKSLPEGIGHLSSLKELSLKNVGLTSLPRGIGNLSSLQLLKFQLESLTSLPESMQELSTLRQLHILSCPQLPSLPEWVANLTALQFLTIHDCPHMMSLPVGLQHLTGLQSLSITECPEMQRRCEETGQDLHKIQHIPEVKLGEKVKSMAKWQKKNLFN